MISRNGTLDPRVRRLWKRRVPSPGRDRCDQTIGERLTQLTEESATRLDPRSLRTIRSTGVFGTLRSIVKSTPRVVSLAAGSDPALFPIAPRGVASSSAQTENVTDTSCGLSPAVGRRFGPRPGGAFEGEPLNGSAGRPGSPIPEREQELSHAPDSPPTARSERRLHVLAQHGTAPAHRRPETPRTKRARRPGSSIA